MQRPERDVKPLGAFQHDQNDIRSLKFTGVETSHQQQLQSSNSLHSSFSNSFRSHSHTNITTSSSIKHRSSIHPINKMKFAAALTLAGLATAAPLQGSKYRFVPGTPEGHRSGSYVPGSIIGGPSELAARAIGPGAAAVLGGVVSGVVAPAVTRWANKAFGPAKVKRDAGEASEIEGELVVGDNVTWDEVR